MSQSPMSRDDKGAIAGYQAAWNALNMLLSQGGSLSGRERNCVFLNCGNEDVRFANASAVSGFDFPDDARGMALTDWDHDGDIDVWVNNRTSPRLRFLRNQKQLEKDFISFRLIGTSSNRDGIGGRVEVRLSNSDQPLVSSVRAGDGYLSQSSKWLHFGLGTSASIESVEINWPGGTKEQFTGAQVGGHFVVQQGKGIVSRWQRPGDEAIVLESSENPPREGGSLAQVFLPRPVPLPQIEYLNGGASKTLHADGKPQLLLLYASWCPNCLAELTEVTANVDQLRGAGLNVLALSVDGIQTGVTRGSIAEADALMQRLDFPFQTGHASRSTLEKLSHVEGVLFEIQSDFAVPMGFLIDGDHNLIAIYRGPVPIETLLYDARHIPTDRASETGMRDVAIPFPGKWYTLHPERTALLELLADHFQGPFPEDAVRYLEMTLAEVDDPAVADRVHGRIAGLHYKLGTQALAAQLNAKAEARFRETLAHRPNYAPAHHNLGVALFSQGKNQEAESSLLKALELSPGNPRVLQNLDVLRKKATVVNDGR
ncbi:MAG: ASPIC/UnbV domain-containing protein [Verrucomicrobiales bacterium]